MFCESCLHSVAHITTIYLFILLSICLNRSSIPYSPSPILDPRSWFSSKPQFYSFRSSRLFQSNQRFQAIEFVDRPVPEKLDMAARGAASGVRDSQVQSYPNKHIRDTYVTLGWISTPTTPFFSFSVESVSWYWVGRLHWKKKIYKKKKS